MLFPESENIFSWPMKCVRRLVNQGYLKGEKPGFCDRTLYYVTLKGAKILRDHGMNEALGATKKIDSRTWEHDLMVTDVRIIFEKLLRFSGWISERKLRKELERKKVPDGIIFDGEEVKFVIEVERSLKKKKYYQKIFPQLCLREYRGENEIVLYIAENETDKRWLMKQAKGWERIFFTTIKAVLEMKYTLELENWEGYSFKLTRHCEGGVHFTKAPLEDHEDEMWREIYRAEKETREFEEESKRKESVKQKKGES